MNNTDTLIVRKGQWAQNGEHLKVGDCWEKSLRDLKIIHILWYNAQRYYSYSEC